MVAYDNYQKNTKKRNVVEGKSSNFFNGTMRVYLKAIGVDERLSKTIPTMKPAEVTSDDVSNLLGKEGDFFFFFFWKTKKIFRSPADSARSRMPCSPAQAIQSSPQAGAHQAR